MDGPIPKKRRLSTHLPSDPSIPLPDGSAPFQNAHPDIIDYIFRRLIDDNIKTKMGLEIVCLKFRHRIKERRCWFWNNKLKLAYNEYNNKVKINNTHFDNSDTAANALGLYLKGAIIREVEFESAGWSDSATLDLQTGLIRYGQMSIFPFARGDIFARYDGSGI